MKLSKAAKETLNQILTDFEGEELQILDEFGCKGVCGACGHMQHGVEPDAEGYECESCNELEVMGIENAFLILV